MIRDWFFRHLFPKEIKGVVDQTHQETIDAMCDYAVGKISFERCAEIMDINFYELADFCAKKRRELDS